MLGPYVYNFRKGRGRRCFGTLLIGRCRTAKAIVIPMHCLSSKIAIKAR